MNTSLLDGFYSMEIITPAGRGGGVMVLEHGRIRGGGATIYFFGTFRSFGGELLAEVVADTHQLIPGFVSTIGNERTRLSMSGELLADGRIVGTARSDLHPGQEFTVTMRRLSEGDGPILFAERKPSAT